MSDLISYEEYMHGTETLSRIEYKDLETGETAFDSGVSIYVLTEGNWSCDCNRETAFGHCSVVNYCIGCERYIVIDIESEILTKEQIQDVINEANQGYSQK